jgi:hypothetical protein
MAGNQLSESIDKWRADPIAPGTTAVLTLESGDYDVMAMSPSEDSVSFNISDVRPDGYEGDYYDWGRSVDVTITDATGRELPVTPVNDRKSLAADGYLSVAVGEAEIPRDGEYEVTVGRTELGSRLNPEPAGIGLMQMDVGALVKRMVTLGALMFLLFVAGVVLLIVTFVRRRRQRKPKMPQYFVPTNPTWPPPPAQ